MTAPIAAAALPRTMPGGTFPTRAGWDVPGLLRVRPEAITIIPGGTIPAGIVDALTAATLTRSISGASTIALTFDDPHRVVASTPLLTQKVVLDLGTFPSMHFQLVGVAKSKNVFTATYEDSLVAKLRTITGARAAAKGVVDRVAFVLQLCREAGLTVLEQLVAPPPGATAKALNPLTRGTSQTPAESTWDCFQRLAQDVAWRCWSDGSRIFFGPDSFWTGGAPHVGKVPAMTIAERAGNIDYIDFDHDVGKPAAQATVYTYAPAWVAAVGDLVRIADPGCGVASGPNWIVEEISRDLFHSPVTVKLVAPAPALAEPAKSA